jgi:transcriptional regulator with XRE-family HTH domain
MAHPTIYRNGLQRHFVPDVHCNAVMETIGVRIRKRREDMGISRADLAKHIGLAYSSLSDLESGKAKSTTVLHKIAARLGVNVDWLETGKGVRDASPALRASSLDREIIADVAQGLLDAYKAEHLRYDFTQEYELFADLYEEAAQGRLSSIGSQVKIGRWIERRAAQEAERNGRVETVPDSGADKGDKGVQGRGKTRGRGR